MIISFDLDETLFVNPEKVPTEKPLKFPLNRIYRDRLRAGAVDLLTWINKSDVKYRIDLHVDDEKSVYQNGIAHGFRVYLLSEDDIDWTERLKAEIIRIKNNKLI